MSFSVNVLSAPCGAGKTNRLIKMISELSIRSKVIYVTPLLSECFRISGAVKEEDSDDPIVIENGEYLYEPNHVLTLRRFRHPMQGKSSIGTKVSDLEYLIKNDCNIVATHALYKLLSPEIIELIKSKEYILVLDETLSMYEEYSGINSKSLATYFKNNWLYLDADGITLRWNHKFDYDDIKGTDEIGRLCDNSQLLTLDGKGVIVEFPIECLRCFHEVWIATYLFEGSQMYSYLKHYDAEINIIKFGDKPSEYAPLIDIVYDLKYNSIGNKKGSLSYTDLCEKKTNIDELASNLNHFMRYKIKSRAVDRLWTTYKPIAKNLSKGRHVNSWIPFNTRATNDYVHTFVVAYLVNVHLKPIIIKLMAYRDCHIDQELYALSEMVQFIFRSRIRNKEPIKLYVPSLRMRNLLIRWLNDEFEEI